MIDLVLSFVLPRHGKEGTLKLDDQQAVIGRSEGVLQVLNTLGNVFIGE